MKENLYLIDGMSGAWRMNSQYIDENDNIIIVFQNLGSGEYTEVEVCPFDWIIKTVEFNKWDSK